MAGGAAFLSPLMMMECEKQLGTPVPPGEPRPASGECLFVITMKRRRGFSDPIKVMTVSNKNDIHIGKKR